MSLCARFVSYLASEYLPRPDLVRFSLPSRTASLHMHIIMRGPECSLVLVLVLVLIVKRRHVHSALSLSRIRRFNRSRRVELKRARAFAPVPERE